MLKRDGEGGLRLRRSGQGGGRCRRLPCRRLQYLRLQCRRLRCRRLLNRRLRNRRLRCPRLRCRRAWRGDHDRPGTRRGQRRQHRHRVEGRVSLAKFEAAQRDVAHASQRERLTGVTQFQLGWQVGLRRAAHVLHDRVVHGDVAGGEVGLHRVARALAAVVICAAWRRLSISSADAAGGRGVESSVLRSIAARIAGSRGAGWAATGCWVMGVLRGWDVA